ncbi:MAG: beta-ketoacyl-ACP reductase [Spirochaetaceae bacterium]|nr:MAG: beta-ketoacyl-ACP reductase [Spirochaetaceae bacterium]
MVNGKVCVVTGGGRGIGKTIVETLAANGAEAVYALDINNDALSALSGDAVHGEVVNVLDSESIKTVVEKIIDAHGRIDILVNNAGITRDAVINKMDDEAWQAVIDVNLKGVFLMTREIGPRMMEHGSGSIVNISSVVGLDGNMGQTNYAATKAGVIAMAKTWAKEFARKGAAVRANAVAPGFINTPMLETVPEKVIEGIKAKTPLKRLGEPQEIANLVLFLSSDLASYITGQVIRCDGGLVV